MAFSLLDDKFHHNPKVLGAGNAAVGLYARLLSWANDELTDGFIPSAVALSMGTRREIAALVAARRTPAGDGLLVPTDGGWLIHDFLEHNDSADVIRRRRSEVSERRAAAGRLGGIASGESRRRRTNGEANGEANRQQTEAPHHHPHPHPPVSSLHHHPESVTPDRSAGGGGDDLYAIAAAAASHLAAVDAPKITNRVAWLAAVARRLATEYSSEITAGIRDGRDPDDLAGDIARLSLGLTGLSAPDHALTQQAARRLGASIAIAQLERHELDRDAAVAELTATFPNDVDSGLAAWSDIAATTPPPRHLHAVEEA